MKTKIISSSIIILFFAGFIFFGKSDIYYEISKNLEIFSKIYKEISFNYVDEINSAEFINLEYGECLIN
jgi:carboxyl-terminal processing protease